MSIMELRLGSGLATGWCNMIHMTSYPSWSSIGQVMGSWHDTLLPEKDPPNDNFQLN